MSKMRKLKNYVNLKFDRFTIIWYNYKHNLRVYLEVTNFER